MAFMFDYIRQIDVQQLGVEEVLQCLLYLDYLQSGNNDFKSKSRTIRKKMNDRLRELEGVKS